MVERSHASIKQALKIETGERRSLWHKHVSIGVLDYKTFYHASIGSEPNRVFHKRIAYNFLGLKLGIRLQQTPILTSQIAQDVLDQTEIIYQDVRENAMQAYIEHDAHHDKKSKASKLKDSDYLYVLQPRDDHRGIENLFTKFRWIGPYLIQKVLPNNIYLVRKIGTNKTQLRQFTPRHTLPDIQMTPQEWKPDPKMSAKYDDLYARARECEFEGPIFDAKINTVTPPNSPEGAVLSDLSTEETWNTPGASLERSPENFPQPDELCDVTDTYPYMELDAETSSEQPNPSLTNPRSTKYSFRHNPKPNCNDEYRY